MKLGKRIACWLVALPSVFSTPSYAETTDNQVFETRVFLTTCTELVPNVPLAIPMDAQCISQGRKMCDLAILNPEPETCIAEVTAWMRDEVATKWPQIPQVIRLDHATPPTAEEMKDDAIMASLVGMMPNCETVKVDGVSKQTVCEYSDALGSWHALRILERSANELDQ
ncbi:hypothetical protein M3P21_10675 [Ruegeria sp. 2012CJ41-6]|uniref:Secreted protein n=1 Tax=Ruegeria spongiae TaxID=2942209 RepID=A0ABT0Q2D0_9RHOB|nr:hypothetical protein [Ruegeria spongiae]MCL6283995.1 hypothetical protein [Ruegeria spongiae]